MYFLLIEIERAVGWRLFTLTTVDSRVIMGISCWRARARGGVPATRSRLCVDGSVLHALLSVQLLSSSICRWFSFRRICKLRFVYIIHSHFLQLCVRFSQLTNECQFHCWYLHQLIYLRGVSRSDCVSSRYYASSISEALCIDSALYWEMWSIFTCWFKFWRYFGSE